MKLSYDGHSLTYPGLTGYAGYTMAPQETSALYYSSNDTISAKNTNTTATQSINTVTTAYNFQVVTFQEAGSATMARDWKITPHGWEGRNHYLYFGNYKAVRNGGTFTAVNGSVKLKNVDNINCWYYTAVPETTWAYFKLVTDQSANRASAFWNDVYLGYGNINHVTGVSNISVVSEQNTSNISARYFRVAGFDSLSDAVSWTSYRA